MSLKQCPPGKILNPLTNRCVKIDGAIGKKIVAAAHKPIKQVFPSKSPPKQVSPQSPKTTILKELQNSCNNDADPISMDAFADMSVSDLKNLVKVGKGDKKNCYMLENIYEVYKTAVLAKKPVKDPMDPSHILSKAEIDDINAKMKAIDSKYLPPKHVSPKPYPTGYSLETQIFGDQFTIRVVQGRRIIYDFGVVPAWVETRHTGSADNTSGVLISNIRELWDRRLLNLTNLNVPLNRNATYWQGATWKRRFIELCNNVKEVLEN